MLKTEPSHRELSRTETIISGSTHACFRSCGIRGDAKNLLEKLQRVRVLLCTAGSFSHSSNFVLFTYEDTRYEFMHAKERLFIELNCSLSLEES